MAGASCGAAGKAANADSMSARSMLHTLLCMRSQGWRHRENDNDDESLWDAKLLFKEVVREKAKCLFLFLSQSTCVMYLPFIRINYDENLSAIIKDMFKTYLEWF